MRRNSKSFKGLVSLVWRKEIQKNGNDHFHIIIWTVTANPLPVAGQIMRTWCKRVSRRCEGNPADIEKRMMWVHFRGQEVFFDADLSSDTVAQVIDTVKTLTRIDGQGFGVEYLVKHAGRFKDYQARTVGRAWGIWNRKRLPRIPRSASTFATLSPTEEVALARILRHLSRYAKRSPCIFGWHWCHGRRFARGVHTIASARTRDAVGRWLKWMRSGASPTC